MSARPHTHRTRRTHRTMPHLVVAPLAAALLLTGLTACGEDTAEAESTSAAMSTQAATVVVEDPWVRATTGTEDPSMSAAFMVLDNDGDDEVTVTGASSPVAGRVELHEMAMVDGAMVMRETEEGITLAPGRGQVLQPGGLHVMLMDLRDELAPGDEVEVTLVLDDGTTVDFTAPVKEFTEEEGHYHAPGTDPDHGHDGDMDDMDAKDDMGDDGEMGDGTDG